MIHTFTPQVQLRPVAVSPALLKAWRFADAFVWHWRVQVVPERGGVWTSVWVPLPGSVNHDDALRIARENTDLFARECALTNS